jgi:hypothetical protein
MPGRRAAAWARAPVRSGARTVSGSIRAKAPNARVIVVGYPRLFMGEDCNALTWFSPTEQSRLNGTADLLNSKLSSAAAAKGFTFANPTSRFIGHAVCDSPEWVNGLSSPISESYHPNRAGHASGYAPLTKPLFGVTVKASTAKSVEARAEASAARLTADARRYATLDRSITPKEVVAPDLTTPRAKAAAARAGVDLTDRASIDRADRAASAIQDAAWAATSR